MTIYSVGGGSDWPRNAPKGSFYFCMQYTEAEDYAQACGVLYGAVHAALADGREGSVRWEHRPIQGRTGTDHYICATVTVDACATFEHGRLHRMRIAEGRRAAWRKVDAFREFRA